MQIHGRTRYARISRCAFFISLIVLLVGASHQGHADECSDILREGTKRILKTHDSQYARLLVAAYLSTRSQSEAQEDEKAGAVFPVDGFPVDAQYSKKKYDKWISEVKSSIDIDSVFKSESSVVLSEGDPTIVNGWLGCMNSHGGLIFYLNSIVPDKPALRMKYIAPPGAGISDLTIQSPPEIINATITSGSEYLAVGAKLSNVERIIGIDRIDATKPVVIRINTSVGAGETALAALKPLPPLPHDLACHLSTVVSTDGQCPSSGQVYVGPHTPQLHWGTCISASPCTLVAEKTVNKNCVFPSVYVGPNSAWMHGGHCLTLLSDSQLLVSKATSTKDCGGAGAVYAGPNDVAQHWGSCVSIVDK